MFATFFFFFCGFVEPCGKIRPLQLRRAGCKYLCRSLPLSSSAVHSTYSKWNVHVWAWPLARKELEGAITCLLITSKKVKRIKEKVNKRSRIQSKQFLCRSSFKLCCNAVVPIIQKAPPLRPSQVFSPVLCLFVRRWSSCFVWVWGAGPSVSSCSRRATGTWSWPALTCWMTTDLQHNRGSAHFAHSHFSEQCVCGGGECSLAQRGDSWVSNSHFQQFFLTPVHMTATCRTGME